MRLIWIIIAIPLFAQAQIKLPAPPVRTNFFAVVAENSLGNRSENSNEIAPTNKFPISLFWEAAWPGYDTNLNQVLVITNYRILRGNLTQDYIETRDVGTNLSYIWKSSIIVNTNPVLVEITGTLMLTNPVKRTEFFALCASTNLADWKPVGRTTIRKQ